jgi:predicted LPLAT superfamily acyltransferase
VYRHAHLLKSIVDPLLALETPLFLVDDGNEKEEAEILEEIAKNENVHLLRNEKNLGKGAAMFSGFQAAHSLGYSHALQIDADGQHCIDDIPRLFEAASEKPDNLILGTPIFNDSAPKSRVYGRKLTTWMVWLETLSLKVEDALYGFRVYPLKSTIQVMREKNIEKRMGFDPEIVVQMVRSGVDVTNIATPVDYPSDGYSNFNYLRDNSRMVYMHARLILSGLFSRKSKPWYGKAEHGSVYALRLLMWLYRVGGKRLLDALMYPVVFFYFLKDGPGRKASREYMTRVTGSPGSTFKHFKCFGEKIVYSIQAWLGEIHPKDVEWHDRKMVYDQIDKGQGGLVLSAHFGCLEVTRATQTHKRGLKITPLMYLQNSKNFRAFLKELNPQAEKEIIYVEGMHPGVAIDIKNRVDSGEFIVMLADRVPPGSPERSIDVSFFGETAKIPEGPFVFASSMNCPVFCFFSYFDEERGKHIAHWEEFAIERPKNRGQRREALQQSAQNFAHVLEKYCRKAPYQWFNFYDFWHGGQ